MEKDREILELKKSIEDWIKRIESDPRSVIGLSGENYYDVSMALKKEREERKKYETPPKDGMVYAY